MAGRGRQRPRVSRTRPDPTTTIAPERDLAGRVVDPTPRDKGQPRTSRTSRTTPRATGPAPVRPPGARPTGEGAPVVELGSAASRSIPSVAWIVAGGLVLVLAIVGGAMALGGVGGDPDPVAASPTGVPSPTAPEVPSTSAIGVPSASAAAGSSPTPAPSMSATPTVAQLALPIGAFCDKVDVDGVAALLGTPPVATHALEPGDENPMSVGMNNLQMPAITDHVCQYWGDRVDTQTTMADGSIRYQSNTSILTLSIRPTPGTPEDLQVSRLMREGTGCAVLELDDFGSGGFGSTCYVDPIRMVTSEPDLDSLYATTVSATGLFGEAVFTCSASIVQGDADDLRPRADQFCRDQVTNIAG